MLEILRLHGGDAYHMLRQAIEAAGSADLVRREPNLTKVWLAAGNNDQAYRQYKDAFNTNDLLPLNDDLTKELRAWYRRASKLAHGSIFGVANRLRIDREPSEDDDRFRIRRRLTSRRFGEDGG